MRQMISLIALLFWIAFPLAAHAADGMEGMDMSGMDMSMPGHAMSAPAEAATAPKGPAPTIVIAPRTEEGKRMLGATVTLAGKPLVGAKVDFFVQETFGLLGIGRDETDDGGIAAVKFPEGLPGGTRGKLHIIARVTAAPGYAAASADAATDADVIVVPDPDPFPRAIWSPHAPIPLILTLALALGGVWTTYGFVLFQLRALRKAGDS